MYTVMPIGLVLRVIAPGGLSTYFSIRRVLHASRLPVDQNQRDKLTAWYLRTSVFVEYPSKPLA